MSNNNTVYSDDC